MNYFKIVISNINKTQINLFPESVPGILRITFFVLILGVFGCGKKKESAANENTDSRTAASGVAASPMREKKEQAKDDSAPAEKNIADVVKQNPQDENKLGKVFSPFPAQNDRYLEYSVILSYSVNDLIVARKDLLTFIPKYGFLDSSSANTYYQSSMTAKIFVRSNKLYEALQDLDKLGTLTSENISSVDHTDNLVWQKRKSDREKKRISRRNLASAQIGAGSKNWEEVENSLSASEDEQDQAEQEIWRVRDKVSWAAISVNLSLPHPPLSVQVPEYKNGIVGVFNLFLQLSYYLIWIIPFMIIAAGCYYIFRKIFLRFMKK